MWPEVTGVHVALAQMKSKGLVEDRKDKMKLLLLSLKVSPETGAWHPQAQALEERAGLALPGGSSDELHQLCDLRSASGTLHLPPPLLTPQFTC